MDGGELTTHLRDPGCLPTVDKSTALGHRRRRRRWASTGNPRGRGASPAARRSHRTDLQHQVFSSDVHLQYVIAVDVLHQLHSGRTGRIHATRPAPMVISWR